MSKSYPEITRALSANLRELRKEAGETMTGFSQMTAAAMKEGALDKKTKELIALAPWRCRPLRWLPWLSCRSACAPGRDTGRSCRNTWRCHSDGRRAIVDVCCRCLCRIPAV